MDMPVPRMSTTMQGSAQDGVIALHDPEDRLLDSGEPGWIEVRRRL